MTTSISGACFECGANVIAASDADPSRITCSDCGERATVDCADCNQSLPLGEHYGNCEVCQDDIRRARPSYEDRIEAAACKGDYQHERMRNEGRA